MYYDPNHNVLIYETADPRVLQYVPGAKPVNGSYIAVPYALTNLQIMRVLGFPVIRPLEAYDWPRATALIKKPFHAQVETANFLAVHPRCCVLSDMGTGKTLSALWAADALMRDHEAHGERLRAIVVAPLSTLQTVWADAIFSHFLNRRKAVILHGTPEKRIEALAQDADFYLINHDGIKVGAKLDKQRRMAFNGFAGAMVGRKDIGLAIVDEVGAFRDYRTLRSKAGKSLLATRDYLWLMTGTPTPNGPEDAYGIGHLLNGCRGEPFTHYKRRVMTQVTQFKWVPRAGANEAAQALMKPSIRFSIDDCQDLPELTSQTREVDLSADQVEQIKILKRDLLLLMDKGVVDVANEAALRLKLMQIACGVIYDRDHKEHRIDCLPRLKVLREIIEEAGSKVIVFAPFISVVNMVNESLKEFSRAVIIGATKTKERDNIIRAFQQERDPHVLVAHPETICEGQTLTAAATIVWYGPVDKTRVYIQANKRIHRPGQLRPCTVVNLASTTVERETYRRLANNESMQGVLLDLVRNQKL